MPMMQRPAVLDLRSSSDDPCHDRYVMQNIPFRGFLMYRDFTHSIVTTHQAGPTCT